MDEPKEGATTLKKKAQEKLAAKANPVVEEAPVVEASEPQAVAEVAEVPAEVVVSEPQAVAEVAEVPAEVEAEEKAAE
jgi:small subunit ribosomal protein S16